ncbi:MAG TPA: hypothetical protein VM840_12670 [Actinomycetota bacterium]|jgi:hypothetical protein|nr:hypothetical protein [Actinomycetota bacterium]
MPGPLRTVYLGQFTDELANEIAGALHDAGIAWTYKQAGAIGKALFIGEWGTRLYVDDAKIEQAREIAEGVKAAYDAEPDA